MSLEGWRPPDLDRRGFLKAASMGAGALAVSGALGTALEACGGGGGENAGLPSGQEGITKIPTKPYDPKVPAGEKPSGLPDRIGFMEPASNEVQSGYEEGVKAAADKFDLEVATANADGKAVEAVDQTNTMLAQGIAGLFDQSLDPSQAAGKLQAIKSGVIVFDLEPPMTTVITADQYATGAALGKAAATYIRQELGGRAQVLIINEGPIPVLQPRYQGIRETVEAAGPGTKVVVDVPAQPVTQDNGFKITSTALQAHPGINVILGVDDLMIGALSAVEAANVADSKMFIGGVDGSGIALAKIKEGGPFKASVGFNPAQIGFATGQLTSEWLEGKSVAQAIKVFPTVLDSTAKIETWENDITNPTRIDPHYITLLGNISYEDRNLFIKAG